MARRFDWNSDCGNGLSPREAVREARRTGETFATFARAYADQWPFETEPPVDLVAGMIADMEAAANDTSAD